ncbi:MAG: hypothetical protein WKF30_19690 [Pyrinomonadaceae bacterium]
MTDARNVAHDKKVMEEKKDDGEDLSEGTVNVPQPGKKPALEKDDDKRDDNQASKMGADNDN